ncbi:MAG: dihydropteroate synthase [Opitutales bacterium]
MKRTNRSVDCAHKQIPLGRQTHVVGILNLTPDSFSDGGEFSNLDRAEQHFEAMLAAGADMIDIGGESTRPGHRPITVAEEIDRVIPFIQRIRLRSDALISVDTSKAEVAAAALKAGADIINDVWGLQRDVNMAETIAQANAACILMHNRGLDQAGLATDVVADVQSFLRRSVELALTAGIRADAIILDPGFGFGKTYEENWILMQRLQELKDLGFPLLVGASRKSMLARLLDLKDPKQRLSGTLATTAWAIQAGVDFVRVHDVQANRECADVIDHCWRHSAM